MDLPLIDDYCHLFLNDIPLLDVRAPVEYLQGAFPTASNMPLIDDEERHAIGIRYKEKGQDEAIELGHELVSGESKEKRIHNWSNFTRQYPHGALYCFRGGMRSRISQQWIYENTGHAYPRIKGGYKALRRYLIDELAVSIAQLEPIVLSGRTGVGKTRFLASIQHKIDLEAIYHHRGSSFGRHVTPQPGQIDIENELSIALLKVRHQQIKRLVLEDEAPAIGSRRLPNDLIDKMTQSPLIVLQDELENRVDIVFEEYVTEALREYQQLLGDEVGFSQWAEALLAALLRIQRRLGGQHYKAIKSIMDFAISRHRDANDTVHHRSWIQTLLVEYYDPMYDYQLAQKTERVVFRGNRQGIKEYLQQHMQIL